MRRAHPRVFDRILARKLSASTIGYGTRWKISAIPLGGSVKFFGDDNVASVSSSARFAGMDEAARAAMLHVSARAQARGHCRRRAAGEFHVGDSDFRRGFSCSTASRSMSARVDAVQPDSAAATAGFQPGDLVLAIDGHSVESFADMQRIVSASADETLAVTVERNGAYAYPRRPSRRSRK